LWPAKLELNQWVDLGLNNQQDPRYQSRFFLLLVDVLPEQMHELSVDRNHKKQMVDCYFVASQQLPSKNQNPAPQHIQDSHGELLNFLQCSLALQILGSAIWLNRDGFWQDRAMNSQALD
jgi:hypothetical protein